MRCYCGDCYSRRMAFLIGAARDCTLNITLSHARCAPTMAFSLRRAYRSVGREGAWRGRSSTYSKPRLTIHPTAGWFAGRECVSR